MLLSAAAIVTAYTADVCARTHQRPQQQYNGSAIAATGAHSSATTAIYKDRCATVCAIVRDSTSAATAGAIASSRSMRILFETN